MAVEADAKHFGNGALSAEDRVISESVLLPILALLFLCIGIGSGNLFEVFLRSDRAETTPFSIIFNQQVCTKSTVGLWSAESCIAQCDVKYSSAGTWLCISEQNSTLESIQSTPAEACDALSTLTLGIASSGQGKLNMCSLTEASHVLSALLFTVLLLDIMIQLLTVPLIAYTNIVVAPKSVSIAAFASAVLAIILAGVLIAVSEFAILESEASAVADCDMVYTPGMKGCVERGPGSIVIYFVLLLELMNLSLCWSRVNWGEDGIGIEVLFGVHVPLPSSSHTSVHLSPEVLEALPNLGRQSLPRRMSLRSPGSEGGMSGKQNTRANSGNSTSQWREGRTGERPRRSIRSVQEAENVPGRQIVPKQQENHEHRTSSRRRRLARVSQNSRASLENESNVYSRYKFTEFPENVSSGGSSPGSRRFSDFSTGSNESDIVSDGELSDVIHVGPHPETSARVDPNKDLNALRSKRVQSAAAAAAAAGVSATATRLNVTTALDRFESQNSYGSQESLSEQLESSTSFDHDADLEYGGMDYDSEWDSGFSDESE